MYAVMSVVVLLRYTDAANMHSCSAPLVNEDSLVTLVSQCWQHWILRTALSYWVPA